MKVYIVCDNYWKESDILSSYEEALRLYEKYKSKAPKIDEYKVLIKELDLEANRHLIRDHFRHNKHEVYSTFSNRFIK